MIKRSRAWRAVASVAAIGFLIGGSSTVLIPLLINPFEKEFGWSNAVASGSASVFSLATLTSAPAVGFLLDKKGFRLVITLGVLLALCAYILVGRAHFRAEVLIASALLGIGYCASSYVPCVVVIKGWMDDRRSLGMGILVGAISAGATVFSAILGWSIEVWGWRFTVVAIATLIGLAVPLPLLGVKERKVVGRRISKAGRTAESTALAWQMLFSKQFLLAVACSSLFSLGMAGIYYQLVPILIASGYSTRLASLIFSATWLLSALGSLSLGPAGDRLGTRRALAFALIACAVGITFLNWVGSPKYGALSVVVFSIFWGSTANCVGQFIPLILSDNFGPERLGGLVGLQVFISGVVGGAGPILTGLLFDNFNSYGFAIFASAAVTMTAAILLRFMGTQTSAA